jgi:hypothetical protein
MKTILTQRSVPTRAFLLGMLAGALLVAGSLVVAHEHHALAPTDAHLQGASAAAASATASAINAAGQARGEVQLPYVVVVGHRSSMVAASAAARESTTDLS